MGDAHIDFSEWEGTGGLDEEHLKVCSECRENLEVARFLESQLEQVPTLQVPPFFAARVSRLALDQRTAPNSFWNLFEMNVRRLIPGFAALILLILLFAGSEPAREASDEELWAALFNEPQSSSVLTLDDVLLSLEEHLEESGENHY